MESREALDAQLKGLDEKIREAEERLPAHSTKPATMMMLLELEDERDALLARIKALGSDFRDESTQT